MPDSHTDPAGPGDLGPSGAALWRELAAVYTFDAHDVALVTEACRVKDRLDALDDAVRRDGVSLGARVNPALVESRQQQIVLTRLVASLRLPDDDGDRLQRRGGARGTYDPRHYGKSSARR